jgi:hypothetical protein
MPKQTLDITGKGTEGRKKIIERVRTQVQEKTLARAATDSFHGKGSVHGKSTTIAKAKAKVRS